MNSERMMQILLAPHVSEKSSVIADQNSQHVFKVIKDATKREVKKAVEQLFDVKVKSVNLINVKGKTKRFKSELGHRKDWKKAYVSLAKGHDINFDAGE